MLACMCVEFMKCIMCCIFFINTFYFTMVSAGSEPVFGMDVTTLVKEYVALSNMYGCPARLCGDVDVTSGDVTNSTITTVDTTPGLTLLLPADCCLPCSCHEHCDQNGSCCPDRLRTFPSPGEYPYGGIFECIRPQVRGFLVTNFNRDSRNMVSRCSLHYNDSSIVNKCEYTLMQNIQDIELHIPMSDIRTNITYRNRFCAECNFVSSSKYVAWQIQLKCKTELLPRSFQTLLSEVRNSPDCNIVFDPPKEYEDVNSCTPTLLKSTCNVTGQWPLYSEFIDIACRAFSAPYLGAYGNMFCYLCNKHPDDQPPILLPLYCSITDKILPGMFDTIPTFSLILDFRPHELSEAVQGIDVQNCSFEAVYDPWQECARRAGARLSINVISPISPVTARNRKQFTLEISRFHTQIMGVCRDIFCPNMTELRDRECASIVDRAPNLCNEVFLKVTPALAPISRTMESQLGKQLYRYFQITVWNSFKGRGKFSVYFRSIEKISLNSQQELDIDYSIAYFVIHVLFYDNVFVDKLLSLDKRNISLPVGLGMSSPSVNFFLDIDRFVSYHYRESARVVFDSEKNRLIHIITVSSDTDGSAICPGDVHLITPLRKCQLIKLNLADLPADLDVSGLYINAIDMYLSPVRFIDHGDGDVSLCLSDYIPKVEKYMSSKLSVMGSQPHSNDVVMKMLTFIGTIVSITSLLCTIVTYAMFSVLRTQPGIHNLLLSITILCGQTMFIFLASRTDLGVWCSVIGGLIHFLFQASIFWMAVCCIHMFRVFRNLNTPVPVRSNLKTTCIYVVAVCSLSLCCISINIVASYIMSSGSEFGYGVSTTRSSICYITSVQMIGYTASLPAALVVGFNISLFISVVCKINTLPTVQCSTIQERRYFSIYVKLSTLTGVTWLSVIPYYSTDIIVFAYICNALISLQGLFPFLAFIANKRVFHLYAIRLCGSKDDSTRANSSVSTSVRETKY